MKNPYYLIWSDAIISFRMHHPKRKDWKSSLLMMITWMQALNLWVITLWLKYFDVFTLPLIDIDLFPGDDIDGFLSFAATFAVPFGFINYFLIFYKERYKNIIKKYKDEKIRYAPIYSYSMISSALISAFIYGALLK